jgi:hypothetical protein
MSPLASRRVTGLVHSMGGGTGIHRLIVQMAGRPQGDRGRVVPKAAEHAEWLPAISALLRIHNQGLQLRIARYPHQNRWQGHPPFDPNRPAMQSQAIRWNSWKGTATVTIAGTLCVSLRDHPGWILQAGSFRPVLRNQEFPQHPLDKCGFECNVVTLPSKVLPIGVYFSGRWCRLTQERSRHENAERQVCTFSRPSGICRLVGCVIV